MYFNQTLIGSSSLNIDGVSKRVIYSDSLSKMLQHGIEKSNFSDGPFSVLCILTKLGGALARLILTVFQKELYSESVNKMLQHGIEKSNFSNRLFSVLCILTKL